ncbi:phage antirepressor KilAC domain-containing protein [Microbacterium maritypicum]
MMASLPWPVARIPAEPTASRLSGAAFLILQWPHHGKLRILVTVDRKDVFVCSDDLHALAEFDDEYAHPSVRTRHLEWSKLPDEAPAAFYTLADTMAVLDHNPTHATGELLAWFREQLPLATGDAAIDNAIGLVAFTDAWTVQQAAMILDGDPQISTGRTRLFDHLAAIGWAQRDLIGHWTPLPYATRHGLLTLRNITIRSGTRAAEDYAQLYVTKDGLAELRKTLHALHKQPVEQPAPETLPIPE